MDLDDLIVYLRDSDRPQLLIKLPDSYRLMDDSKGARKFAGDMVLDSFKPNETSRLVEVLQNDMERRSEGNKSLDVYEEEDIYPELSFDDQIYFDDGTCY